MTGKICLLLLFLFVNAEVANTQQPAANVVSGANVPLPTANVQDVAPVQNVATANVVSGANVPNVQLMQNVATANVVSGANVQNVQLMQNVPVMTNNFANQRELVPLGSVNIPNLGNVPVYGVPVSINQAGQLQMGTGLGGLNLAGLNGAGLNLAGLNGAGLNLAGLNLAGLNGAGLGLNGAGLTLSGQASSMDSLDSGSVTRQMSAVTVLSVVVANLWYHWSF